MEDPGSHSSMLQDLQQLFPQYSEDILKSVLESSQYDKPRAGSPGAIHHVEYIKD